MPFQQKNNKNHNTKIKMNMLEQNETRKKNRYIEINILCIEGKYKL